MFHIYFCSVCLYRNKAMKIMYSVKLQILVLTCSWKTKTSFSMQLDLRSTCGINFSLSKLINQLKRSFVQIWRQKRLFNSSKHLYKYMKLRRDRLCTWLSLITNFYMLDWSEELWLHSIKLRALFSSSFVHINL